MSIVVPTSERHTIHNASDNIRIFTPNCARTISNCMSMLKMEKKIKDIDLVNDSIPDLDVSGIIYHLISDDIEVEIKIFTRCFLGVILRRFSRPDD